MRILIRILIFTILIGCQNKDNLSKDKNSYEFIDLYTNNGYKFYVLYFQQETNKKEQCVLAYKIAGNAKNSNFQIFFDAFNKNLNKTNFPNLGNGYILIDNEFPTNFFELNYIFETDSILNVNYNKKIEKIEFERNSSIKLYISDN